MQCLRGLCRNTHFETLPYPTNAEDVTELDDTDTDQKQKPEDLAETFIELRKYL
jgi:hypothetical protein